MMESVALGAGSDSDADDDWQAIDGRFDAPATPSSASDDGGGHAQQPQSQPQVPAYAARDAYDDSDGEADDAHGELVPRRKPGGYDSRVEQILYENPETPVLITHAGKSLEGGGRYIAYTIRTGVSLGLSVSLRGRAAR